MFFAVILCICCKVNILHCASVVQCIYCNVHLLHNVPGSCVSVLRSWALHPSSPVKVSPFCLQAVNGQQVVNVAAGDGEGPQGDVGGVVAQEHAALLPGTLLCVRRPLHDMLQCVGGLAVLLPLLLMTCGASLGGSCDSSNLISGLFMHLVSCLVMCLFSCVHEFGHVPQSHLCSFGCSWVSSHVCYLAEYVSHVMCAYLAGHVSRRI